MNIDEAYRKLQRIETLYARGVVTDDQADADRLEVLVDLASAQFTAGRQDGIERVGQVIDQMRA